MPAQSPEAPPAEKPFDTVDFIMAFEDGTASDQQTIEGFQHLIDDGTVWGLQGFYGRTAAALIRAGRCKDTHNVLRSPRNHSDK